MKPRIKPIANPKGIILKLMFTLMKKRYGKVLMPAKVIYSRYPNIGLLVKKIYDVEKSFKFINNETIFLIQNMVATLNGCSFCMDISKKNAINKGFSLDKFYDLLIYQISENYTLKECAILNYVEEMTKQITVCDNTFNQLKEYCTEEEIIEITYISASENFLNRLIKPIQIGSDELCEIR